MKFECVRVCAVEIMSTQNVSDDVSIKRKQKKKKYERNVLKNGAFDLIFLRKRVWEKRKRS